MNFTIRHARSCDCEHIMRLIMELAVYENMSEQVKITSKELERDGFSNHTFFKCLVAEVPEEHQTKEGHTIVGYCLYFYTYSTWEGCVIYMEDLYVMPEFRGNGIGKAMMCRIAQIGRQSECVRLQFSVLNWNKPSIEFYKSHGALDLTEKEGWHAMRFEVAAMEKLAQMTGATEHKNS
ncbi:diamine acetyltransferase 1-like isoform X1 [Erpetoichthys calabaricus]|uniref:Spermidine/spermine N1-acetyltransferase family member 2b n=1 Tax=Erpetoichthys calabaricus TaxID=27687 RepID=A0A8C4SCN5_ERPCA|nr:diamine acetyltransferase 1-like isoform X1 [Erpetoichthys calabaricus]